jgi:hypothetical protein
MRHQVAVTLGTLLTLAAWPSIGTAQSVADSGSVETQDTTPKKGGLWGKAKKVAGNKVVKAVVKTAACTMVPGGQVIAGAIDAASANSTAEAAQGAAGAAAGTTCMPGMAGAAGAAGAAGPAAAAGLGASGADPTYAAMAGLGAGGDANTAAMVQQMMANAQAAQMRMGAAGGMPAGAMPAGAMPGGGMMPEVTEAPGQSPVLAADLSAELAKGKTAVRKIDWSASGAHVSAAASPPFDEAMKQLATAMTEAGGKYRINLYMDKRYNDLALKMYGPGRLEVVRAALTAAQPSLKLEVGKVKHDDDARVEIVRK